MSTMVAGAGLHGPQRDTKDIIGILELFSSCIVVVVVVVTQLHVFVKSQTT